MRTSRIVFGSLALAACAGAAARQLPLPRAVPPCCAAEAREVTARYQVASITTRRFTHAELWTALEPALQSDALTVREIGRSVQGRPIRAVTFGTGPVTVLLWSQMHGDESTATMALADIINWLGAAPREDALRERLRSRLTVAMVPMLNPDGSEIFQRQNAIGVDVNRDARNLATPEARALKSLRDSIRARFGFNLHDQNVRTLTGVRGQQVAIALLAPAADEERTWGPGRSEARLVASEIASVVAPEIPGRVAKYNDAHEPRAFGDLMQQWGTSTVLIESGAMPGDPEKQRLRAVNVIAILSALDAIATGRHEKADPSVYDRLPANSRAAADLLVRGGALVFPGAEPMKVDLALDHEDPLAKTDLRVRQVGDLAGVVALDTVDAAGLFIHPEASMLTVREGRGWIRFDTTAALTLRSGREISSRLLKTIPEK